MGSMGHIAVGGGVLLASFFGAGKRYMRIAAEAAQQANAEIRHDLETLRVAGRLEDRPPSRPMQPRRPVNSFLMIGGTYAASALVCFLIWFAILFVAFNTLQSSVDSSQPAGATALGSGMFAFVIAFVLGLFGIVVPGIPLVFFFAFRENTKRAREEVASEFYRPYWEARTRQMHALTTVHPTEGSVPPAAIAAAELEQFLATDADTADAL
ncbi:hypothetical protein [Brevibacterium zhoupengii]|uniref:hypothetical protein n=1 Tax=Brevibacterium zhoupengii TaxID=2898795 RepID=UPI001F09CB90|nr:hypothetical protein [Brevibacterium zhoupengii]